VLWLGFRFWIRWCWWMCEAWNLIEHYFVVTRQGLRYGPPMNVDRIPSESMKQVDRRKENFRMASSLFQSRRIAFSIITINYLS
jgi:hypothetical protein